MKPEPMPGWRHRALFKTTAGTLGTAVQRDPDAAAPDSAAAARKP